MCYLLSFSPHAPQTFHVLGGDVPDDYGRLSANMWKRSVGLDGYETRSNGDDKTDSAFFLLPSPAFQNDLDDFLRGVEVYYQGSTIFGAIASTVSSLSWARLFRYDVNDPEGIQTLADGCVGVGMDGDIQVQTMIAQGAKPVGGVYQIVKGEESTIQAIALDEVATEQLQDEDDSTSEDDESDEDDGDNVDMKAKLQAAYAKARIPKPVLAEANFLMKTLGDDDQAYMRKALLLGLERGGALGQSPSELARLAEGKGHRFTVHQVASAAMKDGSVTLSLGSVNVDPGTRLRFFVRESEFAKKEVEALWMGHKRQVLSKTLEGNEKPFEPTGCFLFPTLDRGSRFFLGKPGFESGAASEYVPNVPCIGGFFCNGVIGKLGSDSSSGSGILDDAARIHGSASGYILFGSSKWICIFSIFSLYRMPRCV